MGRTTPQVEQKLPLQNWYLNINYQACNTEDISEVVSEVPTERILFNFDSSELSHESKSLLDNYVSYLLKYDDINMQISGHTDSRGGHIYNDLLSYQRAKAVSSYIQSKGVKSQRIELEAYGENRLETAEHNDYEMQLNRRVVLTFMGREKDAYFN